MKRAALIGLLFFLGCSGNPATGGDGGGPGPDAGSNDGGNVRIPVQHRPDGGNCPTARGPGVWNAAAPGCQSDAECDAGTNGRCYSSLGGAQINHCSYDQCFMDSDCGSGVPCACRSIDDANTCMTASSCRVDADCGPNGYCSPSPMSSISCTTGYYCHTAQDQCTNDSDCADAGAFMNLCAYDMANHRWACAGICAIP